MHRRDFLSLVTASVSAQTWVCSAQEIEDDDQEDLTFNGTGLVEVKPKQEMHKKPISHPLWLRRSDEAYRIDVATAYGYRVAQWALRDIQANRIGMPDIRLLIALSRAQVALASLSLHSRFDITSGLRTPETNNKTEGAALASLHLPDRNKVFRATDFRARGFDAKFTAKLMGMVGMGGIGLYWQRDFVHADTGRSRKWVGK